MELLIKLYTDEYDLDYYDKENKDTIRKLLGMKVLPEKIRIINKCPEENFCQEVTLVGQEEFLLSPIRQLLRDLNNDKSSLNRFITCNTVEEKTDLFFAIWKKSLQIVIEQSMNQLGLIYIDPDKDKYAVFFGGGIINENPRKCYFKAYLPHSFVDKYYSELDDSALYYGKVFNFDVKRLDKEDFINYVAAQFYINLGEDYMDSIRSDDSKMNALSDSWIETVIMKLD